MSITLFFAVFETVSFAPSLLGPDSQQDRFSLIQLVTKAYVSSFVQKKSSLVCPVGQPPRSHLSSLLFAEWV